MIFNDISYFLCFLIPSVVVFHFSSKIFSQARAELIREWSLAIFGCTFFIHFAYIYFGGVWGSAAVLIFIWELIFSRLYKSSSKWCLVGIVQAVAILALFKYLNFGVQIVNDSLSALGSSLTLPLSSDLRLPLGISFFTFEFIHFAADSYLGKTGPARLSRYASFIFFFPSMVAGPIKRYQSFASSLAEARWSTPLAAQGITRILVGLAKKHVLADTFTLWSDNLMSDAAYSAHPLVLAGWVLAYAGKIYFDFSGYSDIAIGSGYLFGIKLDENFNWPYLSSNIAEFWRRWHISLGSWIFDYIYKPLGGSKYGELLTYRNLVLAFLISGLWHGANYNFAVWGLWHGIMMVTHRIWTQKLKPLVATTIVTSKPYLFLSTMITFIGVCIGWAFFCMPLERAFYVLLTIISGR